MEASEAAKSDAHEIHQEIHARTERQCYQVDARQETSSMSQLSATRDSNRKRRHVAADEKRNQHGLDPGHICTNAAKAPDPPKSAEIMATVVENLPQPAGTVEPNFAPPPQVEPPPQKQSALKPKGKHQSKSRDPYNRTVPRYFETVTRAKPAEEGVPAPTGAEFHENAEHDENADDTDEDASDSGEDLPEDVNTADWDAIFINDRAVPIRKDQMAIWTSSEHLKAIYENSDLCNAFQETWKNHGRPSKEAIECVTARQDEIKVLSGGSNFEQAAILAHVIGNLFQDLAPAVDHVVKTSDMRPLAEIRKQFGRDLAML
ncbi:hypothetical protein MMC25_007839 [Agyrium rufum]|nr:hypothetical protein [Agyrium rufum]